MIGFTFTDETKTVKAAVDRAAYRNLGHAVASIRKTARGLIVKSPGPAAPGQPIHTRRRLIPNAILYASTKHSAVIGPAYSKAGPAGQPHEHGGTFRGQRYEARPFMGPAMKQNNDRFARSWSASVGP
jgi:hypothetical protein